MLRWLTLLMIIILPCWGYAAEEPTLNWGHVIHSPDATTEGGRIITGDILGNVFVAGWSDGTVDTDTGTSGIDFLIKFDVSGKILWKRQFGPPRDIEVLAMKTDLEGSCYLVGYTPLAFADQSIVGSTDAFIMKFSRQGELLWTRFLGTSQVDRAEALDIDEEGFCYVTGSANGVLATDPESESGPGFFLAKYDKDGDLLWAKKPSLSGAISGLAVAVRPDGCILTAGTSGFRALLDPNGTVLDSCTLSLGQCSHLTFDTQGNLYGCGAVTPDWTAHVQKHDPNGAILWHRTFRDTAWVGAKYIVICTDGSGDVLMGGCQDHNGSTCEAFCRRFDPEGNQTFQYSYPGDICGNRMGVDGIGSCLLTGASDSGSLVAKIAPIYGTASVILEAEDGTVAGGQIIDCNQTCSGTGIVKLTGPAGSTIRWPISVEQSKTNTVEVYYANGNETETSVELKVVGTRRGTTVSLPSTGSWTTWEKVYVDVLLPKANITLEMKTITPEGPYIDYLKLINDETNLLTDREVTCSAEQSDCPAQNALDLNLGTCWQADGFPQSILIDLGQTYSLDKAKLIGLNGQVYQYYIQVAACPCEQYWTVVDRTENQEPVSIASPYTDIFEPVSAQCVKLTITGMSEGHQEIAIREFGVFATPDTK